MTSIESNSQPAELPNIVFTVPQGALRCAESDGSVHVLPVEPFIGRQYPEGIVEKIGATSIVVKSGSSVGELRGSDDQPVAQATFFKEGWAREILAELPFPIVNHRRMPVAPHSVLPTFFSNEQRIKFS